MDTTIKPATNIEWEDEEKTRCAGVVNGTRYSNITKDSNKWKNVQKATDDGAVVTPYVPHETTYAENRAKEYPPVGDQLDAIWKQLDGMELTPDTKIVADKIKAVKDKYPKVIS